MVSEARTTWVGQRIMDDDEVQGNQNFSWKSYPWGIAYVCNEPDVVWQIHSLCVNDAVRVQKWKHNIVYNDRATKSCVLISCCKNSRSIWMFEDARTSWLLIYGGSNIRIILKLSIRTIWICRGIWCKKWCKLLQILARLARNWFLPLDVFHECWYPMMKLYVQSRKMWIWRIRSSEWDAVAICSGHITMSRMGIMMDAFFVEECTQCHSWDIQVALKYPGGIIIQWCPAVVFGTNVKIRHEPGIWKYSKLCI